jgi:hypothetical protein
MATVNKDFKIKSGLIVEGTTGTINGEDILTTSQASTDHIVNIVGGTTLVTSVDSNQLQVVDGELSVKSNVFDEYGAASNALNSANNYTNGEISSAVQQAENYADSLASNYDPAGSAQGAYNNATSYADTAASNAENNAKSYADGVAGTAEQNAKNYADGLATNYDAAGSASTVQGNLDDHISDTSTHGVTGDIVGTSDVQSLSNKTFMGQTNFQSGGGAGGTNNHIDVDGTTGKLTVTSGYALDLTASGDVHVTSNSGDVVLNPSGGAYVGSVSAGNEIATNSYVDNAVSGLTWKQAVNLLYDAAIPVLSGSGATQLQVDGHTVLGDANSGYRLLLTGGSDAGIYEYNSTGGSWTLTRAADADAFGELVGAAVFVMEGTQYNNTSWVQSNHYLTSFVGQSWTQFSGSGAVIAGTGITVDGLEVSIDRTTVDAWYDASGAAGDAEANANSYTDGEITSALNTAQGYANTAEANANDYTDQSITNLNLSGTYDALGAANTAQQNAENYTDSAISTEVTNRNNAIDSAVNALTTSDIEEGTNLYFTNSRVENAIIDPLTLGTQTNISVTYNTGTGAYDFVAENGVADSTTTDLAEGTNLYFTDQRAIDAINNATITPTIISINDYRKEEATQTYFNTASTATVHSFAYPYESVKYVVRVVGWVGGVKHSQITEILATIDGNNNVAVTEFGSIHTTEPALASFTVEYNSGSFDLRASVANAGSEVIVAATLLSWAD